MSELKCQLTILALAMISYALGRWHGAARERAKYRQDVPTLLSAKSTRTYWQKNNQEPLPEEDL